MEALTSAVRENTQSAHNANALAKDANQVAAKKTIYEQQLPDVEWFQQKLSQHGFAVPLNGELDQRTQDTVSAFQMKYRQARFDGLPDAETAALLDVLTTPAHATTQK